MTSSAIGQIGFGTGNLYGGGDRKLSVALVRAALDAGISWFDTAPLYGHGEAEAIVGEALAGHRNSVVLVSKAGILPSHIDVRYKLHSKIAALAGRVPGWREILRPPPPRRPTFHVFAPAAVRACVERSLVALRTDRLDYLLLHECNPIEAADPHLLETLMKLREEGKILGFGTATQHDQTLEILNHSAGSHFDMFQAPMVKSADALQGSILGAGQGIVLHSVLGNKLKAVLRQLETDVTLRARAQDLGIDPSQPDLARRLVANAMRQSGVRAVLFSTSDFQRVRAMAAAGTIGEADAAAGAHLIAVAGNA